MDTEVDRKFEQIGIASYLCAEGASTKTNPSSFVKTNILPAILHRQIYFAFDAFGVPLAFWTWALLTSEVEGRYRSGALKHLHESEWNEGESLWIIDLVAPFGYLDSIVAYIRTTMYEGIETARSRRMYRQGKCYKNTQWRRQAKFSYSDYCACSKTQRLPISAYAPSFSDWHKNPTRPSTAF